MTALDKSAPLSEASYYILVALAEPLHGYGIIKKIETMSNGQVLIGPGTLYGALGKMVKRGWLRLIEETADNERRKNYQLTDAGKTLLIDEVSRLQSMTAHGEQALSIIQKT